MVQATCSTQGSPGSPACFSGPVLSTAQQASSLVWVVLSFWDGARAAGPHGLRKHRGHSQSGGTPRSVTRDVGRQRRSPQACQQRDALNAPTCFPGKCCFMDIFMKLCGWIPSHHLSTQSLEPGERPDMSPQPRSCHLCWHGGPTRPRGPDSAAYTCCCQGPRCICWKPRPCHWRAAAMLSLAGGLPLPPPQLGEESSSGRLRAHGEMADPSWTLYPAAGRFHH